MARLSENDLITAIYSELERTTDYASTTLRDIREKSWNRLLNRRLGNEIEGRSTVRSTLIRDTWYALQATICPAYNTDTLIQLQATGPDDIDQADAESRAMNRLFMEDNRGYLNLSNAISDALGFRNGILKCWVDEREEVIIRSFQTDPMTTPGVIETGNKQPGEEWELEELDDSGIATFKVTGPVSYTHLTLPTKA